MLHSVRIELAKLILVGSRITYHATIDNDTKRSQKSYKSNQCMSMGLWLGWGLVGLE